MKDILPIYLDYQATTPLDPRVRDAMEPHWAESFGNPHSEGHRFGWEAREAVEFARSQVAVLLGTDDNEVIFVSGATESCNLALRGIATASDNRRQIITLATEHPAVLETVQWLGCRGFNVEVLPVMEDGLIDLSMLENALSDQTLLVSVMLVNNEIGVIQPLSEISDLCHAAGAIVHTDATQAIGRIDVDVDELGVDLLSLSGHKIYGPNGVGALYIRSRPGLNIESLLTGGSQERGLRPGTVATPLVVGLGEACEIANAEWHTDAQRMYKLTAHLLSEISEYSPNLRVFGHAERRIPGNLNIGFPGILAERLVNAVSAEVAISTGSACSTGSPEPSHVLQALGIGHEVATTGVRISLGRFTTQQEVGIASHVLQRTLKTLQGESKWQKDKKGQNYNLARRQQ